MPTSEPSPLLHGLGLLEYRLMPAHAPLPPPDLSIPLQRQPPQRLTPPLQAVQRVLQQHQALISDAWLELDQPNLQAPLTQQRPPGLFVRLLTSPSPALSVGLAELQAALGLPDTPLSLPPLPAGLRISHIGLFAGRAGQQPGQLRCNLIGPHPRQWAWLRQHLPAPTQCLERAGLVPLLLAEPAVSAWSATVDWHGQLGPRLGIELFAAGQLQQACGLNNPATDVLLQHLQRWVPDGALQRCLQWQRQQLPAAYQCSFSHHKLVIEPSAAAAVQHKLYLLAHAPG